MPAPPLPFKKVEEMFLAYCRQSNPNHVASTCNVAWHTARRYIEIGDPKRGIRAFRTRLRRVARLVERHTEEKIAYSRSVAVAATWDQLERFDDCIDLAVEKLHAALMADNKHATKIRITDLSKAIEMSAKVKKDFAKLVKRTDEFTAEVFEIEDEGTPGQAPLLPDSKLENSEVLRTLVSRRRPDFVLPVTSQVLDTDGQPVERDNTQTSDAPGRNAQDGTEAEAESETDPGTGSEMDSEAGTRGRQGAAPELADAPSVATGPGGAPTPPNGPKAVDTWGFPVGESTEEDDE